MKKMMRFSILLLLISGIVVSCAEKGIQESAETNLPQDKEYERALELVKNFESSWGQTRAAGDEIYLLNTTCENVGIPKEIQQTLTRSQDKAQPDSVKLYRFEFEKNGDKGFAISVGDERVNAILCYVEKGSIDDTLYNEAMAEYISNLKYAVYNRLEENEKPAVETKADEIRTVDDGPICGTQWAQGWPYNYSCPRLGCEKNNGRALLGCPAVAVAQAMTAVQEILVSSPSITQKFPKLEEWKQIKEFSEYRTDIKEFGDYMYFIATEVNTKFGCDKSSSNLQNVHNFLDKYNIIHCWKSSNGINVEYAVRSISAPLSSKRPVICRGLNKRRKGQGHEWLIEGHRGEISTNIWFPKPLGNGPRYWYCNWGWGGSGNGWYLNYTCPTYSGNDSGNRIAGDFHFKNDFIYIGHYGV